MAKRESEDFGFRQVPRITFSSFEHMKNSAFADSSPTVSSPFLSRRHLLQRAGCGFGMVGLTAMLQQQGVLEQANASDLSEDRSLNPLAPRDGHFPAKAKHVIWIFVNGGPSHVDTWNYRPELTKWNGKSIRDFDSEFKNTTGFT